MTFRQSALDDPQVKLWMAVIAQAGKDTSSGDSRIRAKAARFFQSGEYATLKERLRAAVFEDPAPPPTPGSLGLQDSGSDMMSVVMFLEQYDEFLLGPESEESFETRVKAKAVAAHQLRFLMSRDSGFRFLEAYVEACRVQSYACGACGINVQLRIVTQESVTEECFLHFRDGNSLGFCLDCR